MEKLLKGAFKIGDTVSVPYANAQVECCVISVDKESVTLQPISLIMLDNGMPARPLFRVGLEGA